MEHAPCLSASSPFLKRGIRVTKYCLCCKGILHRIAARPRPARGMKLHLPTAGCGEPVQARLFRRTRQDVTTKHQANGDGCAIIVGAGGAGCFAAITAADQGAKVLVLNKVPWLGGCTMIARAGYSAAMGTTAPQDTADIHFHDTVRGGDYKKGKRENGWRCPSIGRTVSSASPARRNARWTPSPSNGRLRRSF